MAQASAIEWTDATWNPIRGCSRVSQGCVNCYAETVAARFSGARPAVRGAGEVGRRPRWRPRGALDGRVAPGRRYTSTSRCMAEAAADLRQLHVRPVPREGAGRWIDRIFAVMALARSTASRC
jgi:protein gp37